MDTARLSRMIVGFPDPLRHTKYVLSFMLWWKWVTGHVISLPEESVSICKQKRNVLHKNILSIKSLFSFILFKYQLLQVCSTVS